MSNETIVNRVPETFGQKLERERLESETATQERSQKIEDLAAQIANKETQAEVDQMNAEGPENPAPEFNPAGFIADDFKTPVALPELVTTDSLEEKVRQILGVRAHAPRDPDLREFKEQVIRAFKHMGLDTRQFFG